MYLPRYDIQRSERALHCVLKSWCGFQRWQKKKKQKKKKKKKKNTNKTAPTKSNDRSQPKIPPTQKTHKLSVILDKKQSATALCFLASPHLFPYKFRCMSGFYANNEYSLIKR